MAKIAAHRRRRQSEPGIEPKLTNPGDQSSDAPARPRACSSRQRPERRHAELFGHRPAAGPGAQHRHRPASAARRRRGSYNVVVTASDGVNAASANFVWTVTGGGGAALRVRHRSRCHRRCIATARPATRPAPPAPTCATSGTSATARRRRPGRRRPTARHTFTRSRAPSWSRSRPSTTANVQQSRIVPADRVPAAHGQPPRRLEQPRVRDAVERQPAPVGGEPGQRLGQRVRRGHARQAGRDRGRHGAALDRASHPTAWCGSPTSTARPSASSIRRRAPSRAPSRCRAARSRSASRCRRHRAIAFVALEATGQLLKFDTASYAQAGSANVGANARHVSVSGRWRARLRLALHHAAAAGRSHRDGRADAQHAAAKCWCVDAAADERGATRSCCGTATSPTSRDQGRGIPNYLGAAAISPDGTQAWVPSKQDNVKRGGAARRHRAQLPEHRARHQLAHRAVLGQRRLRRAHRPRQRQRRQRRACSTGSASTCSSRSRPAARWRWSTRHGGASCCASTSAARRRAWRCRPTARRCTSTTSWTARVGVFDLRPLVERGETAA